FTGTAAPSRSLQYGEAGILAAAAVCFEAQLFGAGHLLFLLAHIVLVTALALRFLHRKSTPPPTFALVGIGLISGMIGAVVNAGVASQQIDLGWDLTGRRMLTEGMVLLLVLGIGGFLGPRLLGFAELPNLQFPGKLTTPPESKVVNAGPKFYAAAGVTI